MKSKKQLFSIEAINKMFQFAELPHTYEDIKNVENWFTKYTMTTKQYELWKNWFIKVSIEGSFSFNKVVAERDFEWFNLGYGLVIDDSKYIICTDMLGESIKVKVS